MILSAKRRPLWLTLIQIIGFAGGIFALGWAVRVAMREENREQLARLTEATPGEIMVLLSLAVISVGFNGIIFWVMINPIHRIRTTDVIATNAIATFLAYLPFKLSVVTRFVVHNRRDKVPVLTIGAWIICEAVLMMAVYIPIGLVSWWQKELNTIWWISVLVSIPVCTVIGSYISGSLSGETGLNRIEKIGFGKQRWSDFIRTSSFVRIHSGVTMLANTKGALTVVAFRMLDVAAFAMRFYFAARVLDLPISLQDSILLGATYFMIGAASPFGMLGTREAGTIAIASMVGISSAAITEDQSGTVPIAATVLFVTAVEAVVNLGCAGFGIAWLRARRAIDPITGETLNPEE
jgi:Lysylphosphatidylglycerol synthase TM region